MAETFRSGYAVIVGIGADLPGTVADATAMADLLRNPSRCAYPPEQVKLLTAEQADREQILAALHWLAQTAGPDATAIVYFSGHGMETPAYYLMPFGYNLKNLAGTAIAGEEFTARLRTIQAKKLLVLLDCCHAGGQAEAKGQTKSPLPPSAIDQLGGSSGRVVLASSRKDEVSWTGQPYSVFTAALLEGLAGYGAFEQDGYARVLDLTLWAGRAVPQRTGNKQHPIVKVSNLADNFAVAWYAGGAKSPQRLPWTPAALPALSGSQNASQAASWQRQIGSYRENLLLIEERMSEYVEFNEIPLQLVRNKRQVEAKIQDLERQLHGG